MLSVAGVARSQYQSRQTKKYAIIVYWSDEDAGRIAEAPDLDPCAAHGDTPEQALAELRVAMELWLDVARESGLPVPEPAISRNRGCRVDRDASRRSNSQGAIVQRIAPTTRDLAEYAEPVIGRRFADPLAVPPYKPSSRLTITAALAMMMASLPLSAGTSNPPLTAVTVTVP